MALAAGGRLGAREAHVAWLDSVPIPALVLVAAVMALAPFHPEPHLLEKARMLAAGTLRRPLDLFDVAWHLAPTVLLVVRLWRARAAG